MRNISVMDGYKTNYPAGMSSDFIISAERNEKRKRVLDTKRSLAAFNLFMFRLASLRLKDLVVKRS